MAESSSVARLTDIIEAAELIRREMAGVTIDAFETDRRKRWLVERGIEIISEASRHLPDGMKARHIEIISEASRHLPDGMKARHSEIPWPKVAGIGNVLRHDYQDVAHDVLWHVVRDNLPPLDKVCREELAAEIARKKGVG